MLDVFPEAILILDQTFHAVYCNPAFEKVFGWSLDDIAGRVVDFIPPNQARATDACLEQLYQEKTLRGFRTRRLTKSGAGLDVLMDGAVLMDGRGKPAGLVFTLRDITAQRRRERSGRILLRMSGALHRFRRLDQMLDYVTRLIRVLMEAGGASVILLESGGKSFFWQKASYVDASVGRRLEGLRFPADQGAAGQVYRTGEALIVADYARSPYRLTLVAERTNYVTRNMLVAPLRIQNRCIGVLSAVNKREGGFDGQDAALLGAIADVVALPIENATMNTALKKAYEKVRQHDHAKDRVIQHLSHELKTPLAILSACIRLLDRAHAPTQDPRWRCIHERIDRNLCRLLEMEYKLEDILRAGDNPDAKAKE